MLKKVLYISYDGMTDSLGQSQVIPYLAGLSKLGHSITIVSAEKQSRYQQQTAYIRQLLSENKIDWEPVQYTSAVPGISAIITYRRLLKKAFALQRRHPFDVVHCRSYLPALAGMALKKKYGLKFIFDMRGFWADERVEGGIWNLANPIYRYAYHYFKKKESAFLTASDAVISLTENAKQELLSMADTRLAASKITVIPCCVDTRLFTMEPLSPALLQLRQETKTGTADFVLTYVGSLGTWYLLDEMMHFFSRLLLQKPGAVFLFVTHDDEKQVYEAAAKYGIGQQQLRIRNATRQQVMLLLQLSDASVFFIRNTFSKKASSPTKMGELMSLGIPIVCNTGIGDVDKLIRETGAGILVEVPDEPHFDTAIQQLLTSSFSKQAIRKAAEENLSLAHGIENYHKIYALL